MAEGKGIQNRRQEYVVVEGVMGNDFFGSAFGKKDRRYSFFEETQEDAINASKERGIFPTRMVTTGQLVLDFA